jgi:hypothetical protein
MKTKKAIMDSGTRRGIGIGILCLTLAASGRAQPMFFRTVSTQATCIVSLDSSGVLSWSNSIPGANCAIESAPTLSGAWSNYVDPIIVSGAVASVQIPLGTPQPAVPAKYLFEVSYENHAFGSVYQGFYVDHSGFVYKYGEVPPFFTDPTTNIYYPAPYPVALLDTKTVASRAYVGTESRTNLEAMLALEPAAAQGQLSTPSFVGADQGIETFEDGLKNQRVLTAVEESSRTGKWAKV